MTRSPGHSFLAMTTWRNASAGPRRRSAICDLQREFAMYDSDDVASEQNPETRLFTVHISYLARRVTRGKGRSARWESDSARLVIQATSEEDAVARGIAWFKHERAMPTASIAFGTGMRDAIEVRLAESSKLGPAVRAIASTDPHVLVIRI